MKKSLFLLLIVVVNTHLPAQTSFRYHFINHQIQSDSCANKKRWNIGVEAGLGYTGLIFLCYRYADSEIAEETQEHLNGIEKFWENLISPIGIGKYHLYGCCATAVLAYVTRDKKLQKTSFIWAGGLSINSFITNELKINFQRHRPNTGEPYNVFDGPNGPKIHKSFPSAHTSNSFCTATAFATIYKTKQWVPPLAYGIATLVGLSRIYRNEHWASDVLAGAGIGFISTKLSFWLYNKVEGKVKKRKHKVY